MYKHRRKKTRANAKFRNWNYALPGSAKESVIGVVNSIVGREDFASAYLAKEYLSKFCEESLVPASERRSNAIRKFRECEEVNAKTNQRFLELDPGYNLLPRVTLSSFLRRARKYVREILGPLHDEVVLGSFSGGASTSRRRTMSSPAHKFNGKADVTEDAVKFLDVIHRLAPLSRQYQTFYDINVVPGNVLFTVPKKTEIDRCACKEPDINMFLQKGVGRHIRRRLLRFGINLNDQSRNRMLAKVGSELNTLATIDLSSASDTISHAVVKALLPRLWYEYLNDIRSHTVEIEGETFRMEMFSSMGNGFTFELESLIFFVLARTTAYFTGISGIISIYGDDIIVQSELYEDLIWVLHEFGFSCNTDKSFHNGPFRESCGGHYYHGIDVTPFYLKRPPDRLTDVIRVANQLRLWAVTDGRQYENPNLYRYWLELASFVPREFWGGYDCSLDTKLVSVERGTHSLMRVSEPRQQPPLGAYMNWHNTNWNRSLEPEKELEPVSTIQKCRRRRSPLGAPGCDEYFYEEVV